jgi:hypothetical protein
LSELDVDFERLREIEPVAALGNGRLGPPFGNIW